jgi:hypothetical protein
VLSTELCSLVKLKIFSDGVHLPVFVLQLWHCGLTNFCTNSPAYVKISFVYENSFGLLII